MWSRGSFFFFFFLFKNAIVVDYLANAFWLYSMWSFILPRRRQSGGCSLDGLHLESLIETTWLHSSLFFPECTHHINLFILVTRNTNYSNSMNEQREMKRLWGCRLHSDFQMSVSCKPSRSFQQDRWDSIRYSDFPTHWSPARRGFYHLIKSSLFLVADSSDSSVQDHCRKSPQKV